MRTQAALEFRRGLFEMTKKYTDQKPCWAPSGEPVNCTLKPPTLAPLSSTLNPHPQPSAPKTPYRHRPEAVQGPVGRAGAEAVGLFNG